MREVTFKEFMELKNPVVYITTYDHEGQEIGIKFENIDDQKWKGVELGFDSPNAGVFDIKKAHTCSRRYDDDSSSPDDFVIFEEQDLDNLIEALQAVRAKSVRS